MTTDQGAAPMIKLTTMMTAAELRSELDLHIGPDARDALMLTAQEHGQATVRDGCGHDLTVVADDDAQQWALGVA